MADKKKSLARTLCEFILSRSHTPGVHAWQGEAGLCCNVVRLPQGQVGLFTPLLQPDDTARFELFDTLRARRLFSENPVGGVVGYDENEDQIVYCDVLTVQSTHFAAAVEDFICTVFEIRDLVDAAADEALRRARQGSDTRA